MVALVGGRVAGGIAQPGVSIIATLLRPSRAAEGHGEGRGRQGGGGISGPLQRGIGIGCKLPPSI